jgi:hypothetical protein
MRVIEIPSSYDTGCFGCLWGQGQSTCHTVATALPLGVPIGAATGRSALP